MLTDNRLIQIAYPVVIFFSLLLAWNSVGQVNEFAQIQTACSTERLSFLEANSCKEANPSPRLELN